MSLESIHCLTEMCEEGAKTVTGHFDSKMYPKLSMRAAGLCCFLNIIPVTSGFGTMLSACLGGENTI